MGSNGPAPKRDIPTSVPPPKRTIQKLIQAAKPFLGDDLEGTWAIHKLQETLEDAIEEAERALEEME